MDRIDYTTDKEYREELYFYEYKPYMRRQGLLKMHDDRTKEVVDTLKELTDVVDEYNLNLDVYRTFLDYTGDCSFCNVTELYKQWDIGLERTNCDIERLRFLPNKV